MINKLQIITYLLSNFLTFSETSYLSTFAKTSTDRFRADLSLLTLLVEFICRVAYHDHSYYYYCRNQNQKKRQ